jgi:hypothetical protein
VTPSFHRWRRYGVKSSSFDSRLVALPSSSPMLPARANRCTVLRSSPVARLIPDSDPPASSRRWISA